jgi:hypothetical protein
MSLPVLFLPQFWQEVLDERDWYNSKRPRLGDEFMREVGDAVDRVQEAPLLYLVLRGPIRRYLIQRFDQLVVYALVSNTIYMLGVVHGSRDMDRWLDQRAPGLGE